MLLLSCSYRPKRLVYISGYVWCVYPDNLSFVAAAKKVAHDFDDVGQVDCMMHVLSLCISYALGIKENAKDGMIVTPGLLVIITLIFSVGYMYSDRRTIQGRQAIDPKVAAPGCLF